MTVLLFKELGYWSLIEKKKTTEITRVRCKRNVIYSFILVDNLNYITM